MRNIGKIFLLIFIALLAMVTQVMAYEENSLTTLDNTSLHQKAVENAKELVGVGYLWGGKGYDLATGKYVDAETIKSGYEYWNPEKEVDNNGKLGGRDTGKGVDCSGLVMWSFNKAYGATKYQDELNPIYYEGAAGQWSDSDRFQQKSTSVPTKDNLAIGDLLFIGTKNKKSPDHVGIYIGDGKVIHSRGSVGVEIKTLDDWLNLPVDSTRKYSDCFTGYGSVLKTETTTPGQPSPNLPASLSQYTSDGLTEIPLGGITTENTVIMKGVVSDPNGDKVQLEVEVKPLGTAFTGTPTKTSSLVASGSTVSVTCTDLSNGQYHWQARAKNSAGIAGSWLSAGSNSEDKNDFIVQPTAPTGDTIRVYRTATGKIDVLNIEAEYLPYVVAAENGGAPLESMKAQATASRTFAYYKKEHPSGSNFDVYDNEKDQVYNPDLVLNDNHKKSVSETSGNVLKYSGVIIASFYVKGTGSTAKYVTYNEGKSGDDITQSSIGLVTSPPSLNPDNRGCMGQIQANDLANNGYTWQGILRYFYGEDIVIGNNIKKDAEITGQSISSNVVSPKDEITFVYKINNPTSENIENVRLGAQIRTNDPEGKWIDYPANDQIITLLPGEHDYSRTFTVPQTASSGFYDAKWLILDGITGGLIDSKTMTRAIEIKATTEKTPIIVEAGSDQTAEEGANVNFGGNFTASESHTYSYHWDFGDGSAEDGSLTTSHVYADNGAYTVKLTITDEEGDFGNDTLLVTVNNAKPVVDLGSDLEVTAGDPISFTGTFSDSGWLDTHTAEWNFGEGAVEVGLVSEENEFPDSTGTISSNFSYFDAGNYTVILKVSDDDGGVGQDQATVTVRPIAATVNLDPDTLNLGSNGNWVTAHIELPQGYSASNIDINSIFLNGVVPAVTDSKYGFVTNENEYLTDLDADGVSERMFKFNREEIQGILKAGDQVKVTFTGKVKYENEFSSGMASFEGSDLIKVVEKGSKKDKKK